jgi:hypothetical protein
MATGTAGVAAREHPLQMLHFLRKAVSYDTTGISSGVPFGAYLPMGAQIVMTIVKVTTAFNAVTTNVLTVGCNSSSYNDLVAAGDVDELTTGADVVWTGVELDLSAAAKLPYVKYTQTGTAATAGAAIVTIVYAPNTDQ